MSTPTVFVVSATGTQGGAVARQLRHIGWNVHTTTRDPNSAAAQELAACGVKVSQAEWDDTAALEEPISGSQLLFLNLIPQFVDFRREVEHAKSILSIAKSVGVKHVIYSGVFPTHELPQYDPNHWTAPFRQGKLEIEKIVSEAGIKYWTILRPGLFMANFLSPKVEFQFPGASEAGVFTFAYRPDTVLPLIDHEDIGKFTVAAFKLPDKFHEKTIQFAGDFVTVAEAVNKISRATGRTLRSVYLTDEEYEQRKDEDPLLSNQKLNTDLALLADRGEFEKWGIEPGTLDAFLAREVEGLRQTYRNAPESQD